MRSDNPVSSIGLFLTPKAGAGCRTTRNVSQEGSSAPFPIPKGGAGSQTLTSDSLVAGSGRSATLMDGRGCPITTNGKTMQNLIPERTIDAWSAVEIQRVLPKVRMWCPSANRQRIRPQPSGEPGTDPWDFLVGARHVFALENKALYRTAAGLGVFIDRRQHWAMLRLEALHPELAWYSLPAPTAHNLSGLLPTSPIPSLPTMSEVRHRRGFGQWMRVVSPSEVGRACTRQQLVIPQSPGGLPPPPKEKVFMSIEPLRRRGQRLSLFLEGVASCQVGPPGRYFASHWHEVGESRQLLNVGRLMWLADLP